MKVERLREIREDNDKLQKDIAKLLHTTQQRYSDYEIGVRTIPLEKIDKLADFYNTSVDYLIGRTDERKPYPKSILK